MKSLIITINIIAITLILTSCGSRLSLLDELITSEKEIAEDMLHKVINALENEDEEELKSLFTENIKCNVGELDNGVEHLISYFSGDVVSIEDQLGGSSKSSNYGKVEKIIRRYYTVETDEYTYEFTIYVQESNYDEGDNGLYQLKIEKPNDERGDLWILHSKTPGILWDETLKPQDYLAGATRALRDGLSEWIVENYSVEAIQGIDDFSSKVEAISTSFRGLPDYSDFPQVEVIGIEEENERTLIKAYCEFDTKSSEEEISYLIYFSYYPYSENVLDGGFHTIQIVKIENENTDLMINEDPGIYYE